MTSKVRHILMFIGVRVCSLAQSPRASAASTIPGFNFGGFGFFLFATMNCPLAWRGQVILCSKFHQNSCKASQTNYVSSEPWVNASILSVSSREFYDVDIIDLVLLFSLENI